MLLLLLGLLAAPASAAPIIMTGQTPPAAPTSEPRWLHLTDPGAARVRVLAVGPEWPGPTLLLGVRPVPPSSGPLRLVRSYDGGTTWQELPPMPWPVTAPDQAGRQWDLLIRTTGRAARVVLARVADGLYRSQDEGMSWQSVLTFPTRAVAVSLVLSPAFGQDARAYALQDGHLWQTDDGGATWQEQHPAADQRVQQVVFSSSFADDQTIFIAATTIAFPSTIYELPPETFGPQHVDSLGVLRSTDGGATWTQMVAGLEVAGKPYRQVQELAVSPTFGQDGTLFAFAQGPWSAMKTGLHLSVKQAAVFRSHDGGESWEPVQTINAVTHIPRLVLSPSFASDGWVILLWGTDGISPASASCNVWSSVDGGDTWASTTDSGSYGRCGGAAFVAPGGAPLAVVHWTIGVTGSSARSASWDGGQTWQPFGPPGAHLPLADWPILAAGQGQLLIQDGRSDLWSFRPPA